MAKFGARSRRMLKTCHPDLQRVAAVVIKHFDFSVIEGERDKAAQNRYYDQGLSKVHFPHGKHNRHPSEAMHCMPYPIKWNDRERITLLAGHIIQAGHDLGLIIRWGGDWDRDTEVKDNNFDDLAHYELVG